MSRPGNIGILSYEFYIPNTYVNQTEFEAFNKEGKGKYSSGLGQLEMAAVGDREDINSIAATVLINLLEKNSIPASNIGRLEVGTETFQDKSKSTKTFLMDYLQGNSSVEGITAVNACYGAIQALFNSVAWIESSSWDGRLAIVIAADIAIYEAGPARATGGAGAVALLIGPNAPLVLEPLRSTYMENAWDFYKPIPSSEYPVVDGQFSLKCYLKAISECFRSLKQKTGISNVQNLADFYCFHAPYMKLTLKSFTHIVTEEMNAAGKQPAEVVNKAVKELWTGKCEKATLAGQKVGNIYSGSLLLSLGSLLAGQDLRAGQTIAMFAYGSGLAASMFRLRAVRDLPKNPELFAVLASRIKISPEEYTRRMLEREKNYEKKNFTTVDSLTELRPGTVYLEKVDDRWRRFYKRVDNRPRI